MIAELRWLPNSWLKDIPLPEIIIEENQKQNYSGYYLNKTNKIAVVESDYMHSTILHEFIHYKQFLEGRDVLNIFDWMNAPKANSYQKNIKLYFTMNINETEALYYEYTRTKNDLINYWVNHCIGKENLKGL